MIRRFPFVPARRLAYPAVPLALAAGCTPAEADALTTFIADVLRSLLAALLL